MNEETERPSVNPVLRRRLDKLNQDIKRPQQAADNLEDACSILGFSIMPSDRSGDPATDIGRNFLWRLVYFLRGLPQ